MAVVNSDLEVSLISIFLIWPPFNFNLVISIISIIPILLGSENLLHFDNMVLFWWFIGIISILQHVYCISIEKEKMEIFLPFWIFFFYFEFYSIVIFNYAWFVEIEIKRILSPLFNYSILIHHLCGSWLFHVMFPTHITHALLSIRQ